MHTYFIDLLTCTSETISFHFPASIHYIYILLLFQLVLKVAGCLLFDNMALLSYLYRFLCCHDLFPFNKKTYYLNIVQYTHRSIILTVHFTDQTKSPN